MSQNLNHNLEEGLPLNANEAYIAVKLDTPMHPLGKYSVLFRAAHKDFLESLGVKNHETITLTQLDAAVKGSLCRLSNFNYSKFKLYNCLIYI